MIKTEFNVANVTLKLRRFPVQYQHKSLQAWDAADELIVNNVQQRWEAEWQHNPPKNIVVFNDEFGAICCTLAHLCSADLTTIHLVSDSILSHQGCAANLKVNNLNYPVQYHTSLAALPSDIDAILMKIPRTLALLEFQLSQLKRTSVSANEIISAAKLTALPSGVFKLFEKWIGPVTTSLAKKKARLVFASFADIPAHDAPLISEYQTTEEETSAALTMLNYANVFSRQNLDIGARVMLKHMPKPQKERANVIDLGCGNGVLGVSMLAEHSNISMHFVDESFMALASAEASVLKNIPERLSQCSFIPSNCLDDYAVDIFGNADIVVCNPPFHQQNTLTEHIARQMFKDAHRVLNTGGELRIVANRHLPYGDVLTKLFGGFTVIASEHKFVILSAIKHR